MLGVTCQRSELYEMVQTVARAVSGRSSLPILNNIHVEATEGLLRLLATDMEHITIQGSVPALVSQEGSITINARVLSDVAGALVDGEVTLNASSDHSLAISGGGSSYAFNALPGDDFPAPPSVGDAVAFTLPQGILRETLEQTVFAASRDETRPILTGALFHVGPDGLTVVATDTYRLALRRAKTETGMAESRQAIVSWRALTELTRLLARDSAEPVQVAASDRLVQFEVGSVRISSRLIEGEFPRYEKVIPSDHTKAITCDTRELGAALRRVLVVARDDANRVVLRGSGGRLQLSAQSADVGNAEEQIEATIEGEEPEVAFNARFLIDMLDVCPSDEVRLALSGPLNPGTIAPQGRDDYIYVLMPMQIM